MALTAITAVLGVLPIAFRVRVEFLSRNITVGAPSTQWRISLSTAIVFGLAFATILTLVVIAGRPDGDRADGGAAAMGRGVAGKVCGGVICLCIPTSQKIII